jgi:hypothetical protein
VDDALDVPAPHRELLVDAARVAGGGLDPPDRLGQLATVAAQPLRPVAEQQAQVVARIGVERREDLVEVHVGERLRGRDALALGELACRRRARRELGHHVLEAALGPHEDRGVAVDRRVVALDLHAHDRLAVLELDARDLADLDAGDVDRLALARRDRLRGRELGLDLDEVGSEQRHAGRQRDALVAEDDHRDDQRHEDQPQDSGEVAQVLADRGAHRFASSRVPKGRSLARSSGSELRAARAAAPSPVGADLAAAGPLSSGSRCLWHVASGR